MDVRLARFLAITVVIAVLGGMLLSGRARKLERQLAMPLPPQASDSATGPPDSARAIALALHAYHADHAARGEAAPPAQVTSFARDSAGFLVIVGPAAPAAGMSAQVRVLLDGGVELRRLPP